MTNAHCASMRLCWGYQAPHAPLACSVWLIEPGKTCAVRSLVQGLLLQDDLHIP